MCLVATAWAIMAGTAMLFRENNHRGVAAVAGLTPRGIRLSIIDALGKGSVAR